MISQIWLILYQHQDIGAFPGHVIRLWMSYLSFNSYKKVAMFYYRNIQTGIRFWWIAGAILMFLLIGCPSVHAFIMGKDNRRELTRAESAIPEIMQTGKITIGDGGFVTGVLTGANCDVVISAGHAAIYWRTNAAKGWYKGKLRGGGRFLFYLNPGGHPYKMVLVKSGLQHTTDLANDRKDWAIFRLRKPVRRGCKNIRFVRNGIKCNGHIMMPAFHYDRRNTRLIDRTCSIKDSIGSDIIVHDCDTKDGSSGAPILCNGPAGIYLLGINISGLSQRDQVEPGVFGQAGEKYNFKYHKNFAVTIHGEFYQALQAELRASRERKDRRLAAGSN